eukprot:g26482.t1
MQSNNRESRTEVVFLVVYRKTQEILPTSQNNLTRKTWLNPCSCTPSQAQAVVRPGQICVLSTRRTTQNQKA